MNMQLILKPLFATAIAALSMPALADGIRFNGPILQGPSLNGPVIQGVILNGPVLQGRTLNGPLLQGTRLQGDSQALAGALYGRGRGVYALAEVDARHVVPGHSPLSGIALTNVRVRVKH